MAQDNMTMAKARQVFDILCSALEKHDWKFKADAEKLEVRTGARGEDLPMELVLQVDTKLERVLLISPLLFEVKDDKRLDMAIAISACNHGMVQGCFDYDISDGSMFFRMSNCYADSYIGEELFYHMLMVACITVDRYNDKLMMLGKGLMSIEQFLQDVM